MDDDQPIPPPPPAVAGDQLVPPPPSTAGDGVSTAATGVGWRGTDGARCDPEGCGMDGV